MRRGARALTYGIAGVLGELAFTGVRGRAATSVWMLPVYALAAPLFEPLHERLRGRSLRIRLSLYALGFSCVEYGSGQALRRLRGSAPWDYSHARFQLDGVVRADYLPVWAAAGLAFEHLHDALCGSEPQSRSALRRWPHR
jgi:hypothetical protein